MKKHRRTLISLACSAVLCVWGAASVCAQQPGGLVRRRQQLPVAANPTKSGVASPTKVRAAAPQVIAVVHRMSGWKLRTLLTPSDAPFASSFDENFVRTNIVAGFILSDGRTVIARLPQSEAEMLSLSTAFREFNLSTPATITTTDGELLLVRPDGVQFNARFVGLDSSTGLSLLEADQPLLSPATNVESPATPVVGQRVRVIAPVRAEMPVPVPVATPAAGVRPDDAPVGDEGVLYMNMSEEAGQLRAVKRSPSGMTMEVTAELSGLSPEWAGGVALSETGNLVGIIEESDARATRLLSAESVRGAARRVRARRASVPQPWLGARGDALAFAPFEQLLAGGWPREQARSLLSQQPRGVLLTSVAPGTPAAHAGLKPGDVVSRIGQHHVRSVEDMSLLIKELGGNTLANFTVLRAQSAPLNVAVRLSESSSPGLDTARAELRAAHSELRVKQSLVKNSMENVRRYETVLRQFENDHQHSQSGQPKASSLTVQLQDELKLIQEQVRLAQDRAQNISAEYELSRARVAESEARYRAASDAYHGLAVKPLLSFGLEAVRISPAGMKLLGAGQSGLLVMSVQPNSAAAQSKIMVGDIIESINGQFFSDTNWNINFSADYDTELSLGILRHGEKYSFNLSRQNSPQ